MQSLLPVGQHIASMGQHPVPQGCAQHIDLPKSLLRSGTQLLPFEQQTGPLIVLHSGLLQQEPLTQY